MTAPESPAPPAPENPPPPPENPPAQGDKPESTPNPKKETDWVAEARKWEERAKENKKIADQNAAAAKKLQDLEDAQKGDLQKAQERAEAAEKRAADLEAAEQARIQKAEAARQIADWKATVAADPQFEGVPPSALRGTTEDEIREHAAELKALLPDPNARRGGGAYVPAEGRQPGTASADPRQVFADIIKHA